MARGSRLVIAPVLALCSAAVIAGNALAHRAIAAARPTAPTHVVATRIYVNGYGTRARLTFHNARPRGHTVTGYSALCRAGGPASRYKVVGRHSPATLEGLTNGLTYGCTLQARSSAGLGAKSKPFTVPN